MVKCADGGRGIEHKQFRDSNCNSQHVSKIAQLLPSFALRTLMPTKYPASHLAR